MCNFELATASLEQAYPIRFSQYFAKELAQLKALEDDGLVTYDGAWLSVTLKGRLLIRNICMVFDRYLGMPRASQESGVQPLRFSRTI